MDVTKTILIHAIIGQGFSGYSDPDRMVKLGLAYYSGNQHNENWDWHIKKLEELDIPYLWAIYKRDRT